MDSVRKTGKVIILHEDTKTGGIGGEIAAILAEECFNALDAPIKRIAAPDIPVPYSPPLEEFFLPEMNDVLTAARQLAAY
jgi:2-oxoisovalerate dehydrogenase E1 component beta subunit